MSRLHGIGNIYSRVESLIRKNHLKETDKPLWFDVYKHFPPHYEPNFKRLEPEINIRNILYKEDILRAKIHKEFEGRLGVFNLLENKRPLSEIMLSTGLEYISEGMSEDEAIKRLEDSFKSEMVTNKVPESDPSVKSLDSVNEILNEIF